MTIKLKTIVAIHMTLVPERQKPSQSGDIFEKLF